MLSRIIRQEDQRSVMFWLPPGGRDNGVWATTWAILAELDSADAEPLLARLHAADIGGYVATPSGRLGLAGSTRALYVDRDQLPQATDVVMRFLRGKNDTPPPTTRPKKAPQAPRPAATRIGVAAAKVAFGALAIAGVTAMLYLAGSDWLARNHQQAHRLPPSHLSGMTNPEP